MNSKSPQYKIWWDEKNELGRVHVTGDIDETLARDIIEQTEQFTIKKGGNVNWLANLERIVYPPSRICDKSQRKEMAKIIKLKVGKVAIVGLPEAIKVLLRFILGAAGHKKIKFFSAEKEALKWLKQNNI